jgi:hypothetical protein
MTPREELLAAVNTIATVGIPEIVDDEMEGIISQWLQLEADQHWHTRDQDAEQLFNKWDLILKPEWVSMQPCIQMARRINGTEGS